MLDREVELPWAVELGVGRKSPRDEQKGGPGRTPPSSQRGGLEARLFLSDEVVTDVDVEAFEDGDDWNQREDWSWDDGEDWYELKARP